jgi:hypothetical protein
MTFFRWSDAWAVRTGSNSSVWKQQKVGKGCDGGKFKSAETERQHGKIDCFAFCWEIFTYIEMSPMASEEQQILTYT